MMDEDILRFNRARSKDNDPKPIIEKVLVPMEKNRRFGKEPKTKRLITLKLDFCLLKMLRLASSGGRKTPSIRYEVSLTSINSKRYSPARLG
jgi:hypothetical protein